ncbi:hypothetical protein [Clostridium tagluense]|uniref:Uncharacterized protein n=1 Tax=Clostridium tagluense TaxID=360422 RepID=A0A401UQF1_9CLOT|nr:hypothetical protein [Clostridium tagluense]GCD11741.1 hypothetical protein Ctaglu_33640 [Clostridium tagluense]
MKEQIMLFIKYFLSIKEGTNKDIKASKIKEITFSPKFHQELIKQQYIKKDNNTFREYPFTIDSEEGADYWGMYLEELK